MTHKDSNCPFCHKDTSPLLPFEGLYPCCNECFDAKFAPTGPFGTFQIRPEFAGEVETS